MAVPCTQIIGEGKEGVNPMDFAGVLLKEGEQRMGERVDELIATLCDYISQKTERKDSEASQEIAENTKALAALISARAQQKQSVKTRDKN